MPTLETTLGDGGHILFVEGKTAGRLCGPARPRLRPGTTVTLSWDEPEPDLDCVPSSEFTRPEPASSVEDVHRRCDDLFDRLARLDGILGRVETLESCAEVGTAHEVRTLMSGINDLHRRVKALEQR